MEKIYDCQSGEEVIEIFGSYDKNAHIIEKELDVKMLNRDGVIKISGEQENLVLRAYNVVKSLAESIRKNEEIDEQQVRYLIFLTGEGKSEEMAEGGDYIAISSKGRPVKPKTLGQKNYIKKIEDNIITIAIGPAGTGKTYLAVAMAVDALRKRTVSRIILTRPAVEAGEKLGFLPGDLQNKVDPYLRPLYDALADMLGFENYNKHLERGSIEIAPLAYMRGRTLDDAFIILDEAQNTTPEQMKMFLTRIGFGSKAIITGDVTQIDLPDGKRSGLKEASRILKNIEGLDICFLNEKDVVRHPLVQKIIAAYERDANRKGREK